MKRYLFNIAILTIFALFFASCSHEKEAKQAVEKFITAWKNHDEREMIEAFPEVEKLPSYFKADEVNIIESTAVEDGKYNVDVHMKFTNGF